MSLYSEGAKRYLRRTGQQGKSPQEVATMLRSAKRKRAMNPQSGHAETGLDTVEVTDDNADEEEMFPWEMEEIGYEASLYKSADEGVVGQDGMECNQCGEVVPWGQLDTHYETHSARVEVDVRAGSRKRGSLGPCNCENSHCNSGTHYVPPVASNEDHLFTTCPNEGTIPCMYIGQICSACAPFMPSQYLGRKKAESEYSHCTVCETYSGNLDSEGRCPDCSPEDFLQRNSRKTAGTDQKYLDLAKEKFAWPGGYEMYFVTSDGGVLCADCVVNEWADEIAEADDWGGWKIEGVGSEADTDSLTICDNCNRTIIEDWDA